jgi:hydroxyacylglutathione hydrolase
MIKYKKLIFNPFQVNTWVVYDDNGACVLIDPACSEESERNMLLEFITSMKLKPELILATHAHFDHLPGVHFMWDKFKIPFYGHQQDLDLLKLAGKQGELYEFDFDVDPPAFDHFVVDGEETLRGTYNYN